MGETRSTQTTERLRMQLGNVYQMRILSVVKHTKIVVHWLKSLLIESALCTTLSIEVSNFGSQTEKLQSN